jgi:hypothetical protein
MVFSSETDISRFLAFIVEITVNALHPAVLCHWFLFDLEQKVTENVQQSFDYCLCTFSVTRSKALTKILSVIPFSSLIVNDRSSPLTNLPFRLLRRRLLAGPLSGTDVIDNYFLGVNLLPALSKDEFIELLTLTHAEQGGSHKASNQQVTEPFTSAFLSSDFPTVCIYCLYYCKFTTGGRCYT